jgi:hypothetical protein
MGRSIPPVSLPVTISLDLWSLFLRVESIALKKLMGCVGGGQATEVDQVIRIASMKPK